MPHSSGGGHSGGGSHGSSRSKAADMRYGNKYYSGANRYVYYRGGAPFYYYSDTPYTLQTAKKRKISTIITNIFMIFWGAIFLIFGFNSLPKKLTLDYNTAIVINDADGLLSAAEKTEMEDAFKSFQDKTGVTPAFFTISDQELKNQGGNLKKYAYNLYVNTFADEKHWLVVYCKDDTEQTWTWEGMIGNDCGSIITTDLENEFTDQLHKNLRQNPQMLSASVIDAFNHIGNKAGKVTGKIIPTLLLAFAGGGLMEFTAVKTIISAVKEKAEDDPKINSVQCPTAEKEPETAKCEYCGGRFVLGLHTTCPHCGAPIENWE